METVKEEDEEEILLDDVESKKKTEGSFVDNLDLVDFVEKDIP